MPSETKQDPHKDTRKFDAKHNDPEAKVILVSSDNVSFRVHAWYVTQKSDFIKDLFDVPSNQSIENAPIQLNQLAEHVRRLVDLVYSSSDEPILTAQQCHALLEMCDLLQMPTVRNTIWRLAGARLGNKDATGLSPWEAFKLGAMQDNPEFCHQALLAMAAFGQSLDDVCEKAPSEYKDIPGRYLATLMTGNYWGTQGSYSRVGVRDIAYRFVRMQK